MTPADSCAEHEAAIDYDNAFVEKHGVFGEEYRQF